MSSKNDQNFIAFCDELRAYVEEHRLFPDKHTRLSHKIKYTRKKINEGTFKSFEVRLKKIVENLSAIQKTVGLTSIYLKYNVEVNSASIKVIKGIAIPTQIGCNVDIYNAIENKPLSKMPIICAFTQLDCSVLGNHIFDTDAE